MSVIWVAITAMIVGGLLITVLSFIPKSEQQCAHCLDQCKESMSLTAKYSKDREYNICVLKFRFIYIYFQYSFVAYL